MRTDLTSFRLDPKTLKSTTIYPFFRLSRFGNPSGTSQSGHERDKLFLSNQAKQFTDISGVSGLDSPTDGRAFAILDFDRDGWVDIAQVSANAPFFQLFHNQINQYLTDGSLLPNMIALRFVGGNHSDRPAESWSNRDGYGAVVQIILRDKKSGQTQKIVREHRAGEGLAAQNSATMIIGIGEHETVSTISVHWPSGVNQKTFNVPAGALITVYENPAQSPNGSSFVIQPYYSSTKSKKLYTSNKKEGKKEIIRLVSVKKPEPKLIMYTTMAAWCVACKQELPELANLRTIFSPQILQMYGIPVDEKETPDKLKAWIETNRPVYHLILNLSSKKIGQIKNYIIDTLKSDGLPATIITDARGRVLLTKWGPPLVSEIRKLLQIVDSDV